MKTSIVLASLLAGLAAAGCKQESQVATEQAKKAAEETRTDLERTHKDTLVDREAFIKRAETDVHDMEARIEVLDLRTRNIAAEARAQIDPFLRELTMARDDLKVAITAMRSAAPEAVEKARTAVDRAIERIAKAHDNLVGKLAVIEASPTRPDGWLTIKVKAKLASDELVKASDVHVTTEDGIVTLTGKVPSDAARQRALDVTKTTLGVKGIIEKLTLEEAR